MEKLTDEELTQRLIGKDFGAGPKGRPEYFKSLVTGNTFRCDEYINHGWGGYKRGLDLPKDEYPYTILYDENSAMA
jgi:hypothetical protein